MGGDAESPETREPTRPGYRGIFAIAFMAGLVAVFGAMWLFMLLLLVVGPDFDRWAANLLSPGGALALLSGGFLSGLVLSPALHYRRWRLFWLTGTSPAFLLWCILLLLVGTGSEIPERGILLVILLCCSGILGAILGCTAGDRLAHREQNRRRNESYPNSRECPRREGPRDARTRGSAVRAGGRSWGWGVDRGGRGYPRPARAHHPQREKGTE